MSLFRIAHRGFYDSVENTLESFSRAIEVGCDCIEFDVRRLADGTLIVFHDDKLDRLSVVKKSLDSISKKDISGLKIFKKPNFFSKFLFFKSYKSILNHTGVAIPTFADALSFFESLNIKRVRAGLKPIWINVELKSLGISNLACKQLRKYYFLGNVIVSSFHADNLVGLKLLCSSIKTALLVEKANLGSILFAKIIGCDYYHPVFFRLKQKHVDYVHKLNMKINVWTMDLVKNFKKMSRLGVDGIITNRVDKLNQFLKEDF